MQNGNKYFGCVALFVRPKRWTHVITFLSVWNNWVETLNYSASSANFPIKNPDAGFPPSGIVNWVKNTSKWNIQECDDVQSHLFRWTNRVMWLKSLPFCINQLSMSLNLQSTYFSFKDLFRCNSECLTSFSFVISFYSVYASINHCDALYILSLTCYIVSVKYCAQLRWTQASLSRDTKHEQLASVSCWVFFFFLIHNIFFLLCFLLGANPDEQPRPTEQMNGVLHDEELPPQVIKRCHRDS